MEAVAEKRKATAALEYLEALKRAKINPNFWVSEEYFRLAGVKINKDSSIWPELDEFCLTPPISLNTGLLSITKTNLPVWADFVGYYPEGMGNEFLDYEYIYDPKEFVDLSGKKWSTFRKNCVKFPRINDCLTYSKLNSSNLDEITNLFLLWLGDKDINELEDSELLEKYLFYGENRYGLWVKDRLVGINIYDYNWKYFNYRYHFYDPNEYFISEYLRRLFYISDIVLNDPLKRLVNDGGTLGKKNLEFFKDRLNPINKRKVYSWRTI